MTLRRAAPGPQLGGGRLRVDAARAIAKLREYQLADRSAWVLEAIRAAVASQATRIELTGDSNDIWLAWHGPPWDPALLPRLFDELVSPEPARALQHARLLAAAINSALGMTPAYVDVYAIQADGSAQRVRYTPDVLAEPETELAEAPLRHVEVEAAKPPIRVPGGMLVHLRRRASLEVLGYLLGEPPELDMARRHCADIAVTVAVAGQVFERAASRDLVRLPFGDGVDGFVAVTRAPTAPQGLLEVAERGVVLARYEATLLGYESRHPVPLRVFVDADRLPTNASRSQVRRDIHPISTAERRAVQMLPRLVGELAALVEQGSQDARAAALWLLASSSAGPAADWRTPAVWLRPLVVLPLVRDAFGEPRPLAQPWRDEIHTERDPLDPALKEWISDTLWMPPGDPARALLGDRTIDTRAMRRLARTARKQRRARDKFLAHARREARVQTSAEPRIRYELGSEVANSCIPDEMLEGLRGEVCVYGEGRGGAIAVLLDGRELERIELASAIPFDAVIECAQVTPSEHYRGVRRDAGFERVLAGARAGVVRAVESLVIHAAELAPNLFQRTGDDLERDRNLVREALLVAHERLGSYTELSGPLVNVPVWPSFERRYVTLAELRQARAVGVVAPEATIRPPRGRPLLRAQDAEELRTLVGAHRIVWYDRATGSAQRATPHHLASSLTRSARAACVGIVDGELVGALAIVSAKSTIQLHHVGVRIGSAHDRAHELVPCAIAVDSDDIVPNDRWRGAFDDAGLTRRSYREWEAALLRAIAKTILGRRPPELIAPEHVELDDDNGIAFATALLACDPVEVLGAELVAELRAAPLLTLLGSPAKHSIDELAQTHARAIPHLDVQLQPAAGFTPLVASHVIAALVARLADRELVDGRPELERHHQRALFESRYAEHMAQPERPLVVPGTTLVVPVAGKVAQGVVGLGTDSFVVHVHVAGRPFSVIHPANDYPLVAAVEIDADHCTRTFDAIPKDTASVIAADIRAAIPALLELVAARDPAQLGLATPARALLVNWLAGNPLPPSLHEALRAAPAFMTIQGQRVSLNEAAQPRNVISVAAWSDSWLSPADDEPASAVDEPILQIGAAHDELHQLVDTLHPRAVVDVTAHVGRLQARRRMARGLLPRPKVGVTAHHVRDLAQLGDLARKLGHGEIALSAASFSAVLVHEHGQLRRTVGVDVLPAIQLAIEDPREHYPTIEQLQVAVQALAVELVRDVLGEVRDLPPPLRRNIARAVLARRLPPAVLGDLPVFMRADTTWIDWRTFTAQLDAFDNVWAIPSLPAPGEPLDPARIVLVLDAADIELARNHGFAIENAVLELIDDGKARANQQRPRVAQLALPSQDGVLAQGELSGNGESAPRGIVAVLAPDAAFRRGIHVHRAMQPLGHVDDVCSWPTLAVIDDARITPNRTWSGPEQDPTWQAIGKRIRAASDKVLATLGDVPDDALASLRITKRLCSRVELLGRFPRAQVRGVLWLTGVPYAPTTITVLYPGGTRNFMPAHGLPIAGWVAAHVPDPELSLDDVLEQLCVAAHGRLVRVLVKSDPVDRDVVAAHVAHALARNTVRAADARTIEFSCFAPQPLAARALVSLLRGNLPIVRVAPGTEVYEPAFVDDRSELAKVLRVHLSDRLIPPRSQPPKPEPVKPVQPASPPPPPVRPRPVPAPRPKPPVVRHPLRGLVDALGERLRELGIRRFSWDIDDARDPVVRLEGGRIVVAGDSALLRSIAAELLASSILAAPALDALAAHVVSVLNLDLTEITDAAEVHALGVLLSRPSGGQRRSRRSS